MFKICNRCKMELSPDCFSKDSSKKDGKRTICKTCTEAYQKTDAYRKLARDRKRKEHLNYPEIKMHCLAKLRAKQNDVPFNISKSDIIIPELCPILGLDLKVNQGKVGKNSPSLDRIVPELGYVVGNIQVISHLANTMKSSASKEELIKFAEWVIKYFKLKYNESTLRLEVKQPDII